MMAPGGGRRRCRPSPRCIVGAGACCGLGDGALRPRRPRVLPGPMPGRADRYPDTHVLLWLLGISRSSVYLRAAGRERGEPGVDAADGRLVAPVPVLRQSADGAPPAARGRGGGAPSSPAPDAPDGPGGDLPQAAHERRADGSPRLPVLRASRAWCRLRSPRRMISPDYASGTRGWTAWSGPMRWCSRGNRADRQIPGRTHQSFTQYHLGVPV